MPDEARKRVVPATWQEAVERLFYCLISAGAALSLGIPDTPSKWSGFAVIVLMAWVSPKPPKSS